MLKPLGVKKTQEICSMVTESLIIGPKRLLPGLGGIKIQDSKGSSRRKPSPFLFSLIFEGRQRSAMAINICGFSFLVHVFEIVYVPMTRFIRSFKPKGVKMSATLVIHIRLNYKTQLQLDFFKIFITFTPWKCC